MKKLWFGVAVSAVLFSGVSHAAITVDANGKPVITPANTYEIYLSGASAPRAFIEQLLTNASVPDVNQICKPGTTIYKYKDNGSGSDQNAYLCELNTLNPALSGLAAGKTNILLYKRSLGGSAMGVSPIIADSAISFMKVDPSICSAPVVGGGLSTLTCNYVEGNLAFSQNQKADFGVSDVDPIQFSGVNTPAGFPAVLPADIGKMNIKSAVAQTFGIVVTTSLREALQQAQFPASNKCNPTNAGHTAAVRESAACQPTLDSAQLASIFTGKLTSWTQLKINAAGNLYANATAAGIQPPQSRIHICRRTNGSGTGAQFGVKFLNYPCAGAAVATAPKADTGALPEGVAQTQVHQMGSSGQLAECMSELEAGVNTVGTAFNNTYGFRWAIGIQGTENNAGLTSGYRFIKVDGIAPTLQNVVNGKYKDWVELTYQSNKTHVFDPSELNIVNEIIKESGNPVVIGVTNNPAAKHTWGQSGFLAVPQSFAAPANGIVSLTQPVNPLSHGTTTQAPNACRAPTIYNPGVAGGMQLN